MSDSYYVNFESGRTRAREMYSPAGVLLVDDDPIADDLVGDSSTVGVSAVESLFQTISMQLDLIIQLLRSNTKATDHDNI